MSEEETAQRAPEAGPGEAPGSGSDTAMAAEISRRVGSILDAVEREAARLREDAQAEAARYSDAARRRADDLVEQRRRRIAELSDELIAKSEAVVARLDDAAPVRAGFENLVRALGDAAERLANESDETAGDFKPPPFHEAAHEPQPAPPAQRPPPVPDRQSPPSPPPPAFAEQQPHPARAPSEPSWNPQPAPAVPAAAVPAAPAPAAPPTPAPAPPQPPPDLRSERPPQRNATWRDLDEARMVAIQMASAGSTRADVRGHLNEALGIPDPERTLDEIFGAGSGDDTRVPWTS